MYDNFIVQNQLTILTWPPDKWTVKRKCDSSLFIKLLSMSYFPFNVVPGVSKMGRLLHVLSFPIAVFFFWQAIINSVLSLMLWRASVTTGSGIGTVGNSDEIHQFICEYLKWNKGFYLFLAFQQTKRSSMNITLKGDVGCLESSIFVFKSCLLEFWVIIFLLTCTHSFKNLFWVPTIKRDVY